MDWEEIWREVTAVSPQQWQAIQNELRASYNRTRQLIHDTPAWRDERQIGGAIATIVHTAYHLGEIRQALWTLK